MYFIVFVQVFTVNSESKYILVNNVQATGLEKDLLKLCTKYGTVEQCKSLTSYPVEQFTQTFLVKFQDIQAARYLGIVQIFNSVDTLKARQVGHLMCYCVHCSL